MAAAIVLLALYACNEGGTVRAESNAPDSTGVSGGGGTEGGATGGTEGGEPTHGGIGGAGSAPDIAADGGEAGADSGCQNLTGCENPYDGTLGELWETGASFEVVDWVPQTPVGGPDGACDIEDAVQLDPNIKGVVWQHSSSNEATPMLVSAALALAIVEASEILAGQDIDRVAHSGTYHCSLVAGSMTVSTHGLGRSIDLVGFQSTSGGAVSYVDHWEHDTDSPTTPEGTLLYEATRALFDPGPFNLILTPNYHVAHDTYAHFEVHSPTTLFR